MLHHVLLWVIKSVRMAEKRDCLTYGVLCMCFGSISMTRGLAFSSLRHSYPVFILVRMAWHLLVALARDDDGANVCHCLLMQKQEMRNEERV